MSESKPVIVEKWEKILLYIFFGAFLVGMFIFLGNELSTQEKNYLKGQGLAEKTYESVRSFPDSTAYRPDVALLYSLQFSRSLEASHIKTAAVILGTIIVCFGCIIVVYGVEASYQLTVNQGVPSNPSSLSTSSPGLVLITLGCAVIVISLFSHSTLDTHVDWGIPNANSTPLTVDDPNDKGPNATQYPPPKTH